MREIAPIHPGEHLAEFLAEFSISQDQLAKELNIPPQRVNEIIQGKRSISADTALRLGRFFRTTPDFWMNLQTRYALESVQERVKNDLERIHTVQEFNLTASL